MRSFRKVRATSSRARSLVTQSLLTLGATALVICGAGWIATARGELPAWIRNVEARTEVEAAFFRLMPLPGGDVRFRRPPSETRAALGALIASQPRNAELYSLRALADEQQLDFAAAEADSKNSAANSADAMAAQMVLADFYRRRLRPLDEIGALSAVARAPADPSDRLLAPSEQRSWLAFERIFSVIGAQGLSKDVSVAQYRDWIARYPREASLYGSFLELLIAEKDYTAANQLIADYRGQFPSDEIFPVKAQALVEYRQGSLQQGLAVYERTFQPLWAPELVKSYFDLLAQTQNLRKFLDDARAAQSANPDDLNATARIFYYYQQLGKVDAAKEAIAAFRTHKDAVKSWTGSELLVCAQLLEEIRAYPEAARYYFALYNSQGMDGAQQQALEGLSNLLFIAPETPIQFGSGDLSMYQNVATLDPGPGYLNGILSLLLNSTDPPSEFREEERRAVPYFHRSQAAQLLALLDTKFPASSRRPELHAELLDLYAAAGESEAVIKGGTEFLAAFPNAPQRTDVSLLMADAYARTGRTQEEFTIYDSVLEELAGQADRVPLGARTTGTAASRDSDSGNAVLPGAGAQQAANATFQVNQTPAPVRAGARSPQYARVLDRYLARLAQLKQFPEALTVLRREIDRNPDDPGLYQQLAVFVQQNRLGAEEEEIYRRAMARFPDRSWYQKLARFYLRYQRNEDFEKLTQEAVNAFKGSELEEYFRSMPGGGGAALYLRVNQYANARFPHNPVFVRNLLGAYRNRATADSAAWETLLRQHGFEEPDLRNEFFEYLTQTGKLDTEMQALQHSAPGAIPAAPAATSAAWDGFVRENPAAGEYLAQANLWRSHFEDSAPMLAALAAEYPADAELGETASAVHRSLAYSDPGNTDLAVRIETNLVAADPGNTATLARIGDIYADRELFAQAASFWERIPQVTPGEAGGYLEAAAIYWDYFDYDDALRLLDEGRQKLANDSLYRYESGAIYEGKRDYPQAIREYVQGAVAMAAGARSPAEQRLLTLARQPRWRDAVDRETATAASVPNASLPAISLRVSVLAAQNRQNDLAAFLDSALDASGTLEQAADIENLAQQHSLEDVRERALAKQAALAIDPVTRLELRYALVRFYEGRKEFAAARNNVDALYRENPKLLGVVRSTVDFYWSAKLYPQAIAVLLQAAQDAQPDFAKQFRFEAARKSTDRRLYRQARALLAQLLQDSPYDAEYLAAMSNTYAQAGDQQGLKQFYLDQIARFRSAPLSDDDRKTRIADLRRSLIPALDRLEDRTGVVDQYTELINAFPEDEGLATEAARYAARYNRKSQLVDFYSKTVAQSPRDYRWPMVLARIQTGLENFPAAIDAYAKASVIRPDRADLRIARASLEERLMRFDDAAGDYQLVYQLAYKDRQWMEKVAEVRARQGKTADAVAALKIALIDGRPNKPDNYFEVARRLESLDLLSQARGFAEEGVHSAGGDLLAVTGNHAGATLYARIMTRLRLQDLAYTTLNGALSAASASLPVIEQQVAREGIAGVTDRELRARLQANRETDARQGMRASLMEMGSAAAQYFTPEEKTALAQWAQKIRAPMSLSDVEAFAVPMAQSAGLSDLEATWRYELMMEQGPQPAVLLGRMQAYIDLQQRRLKFAGLAPQLEAFAPRLGGVQASSAQIASADAYDAAGDEANELRVLSQVQYNRMGPDVLNRFLALLLTRQPQQLVQMAAQWTPWGEQAADFAVVHGDAALAQAVVAARGRARPPVWSKAYDALVGLYFTDGGQDVNANFLGALGDDTIGDRVGKPIDRNARLAGDIWFYYGSRYGEYLMATRQGTPGDFLPATLEQSPASASGYLALADYQMESGDTRAAIADYAHTLELQPNRADIHERSALAYYKQGARGEAVAQWKLVFATLSGGMKSNGAPENFSADFARSCDDLRTRHLFAELKPDVDALLRAYLRKSGNYRSAVLLRSAYQSIGGGPTGTAWLLDLVSVAPNPTAVLADVADAAWIPLAQRAAIYQRILEAKQSVVARTEGLEQANAQQDLRSWQMRWAKYLVQTRRFQEARSLLVSLPRETLNASAAELVPIELRVAAQTGTLDQTIAGFRAAPQNAPLSDNLRASAQQLEQAGDNQSARKVLEFVFSREIDQGHLEATNFLGLAEARILSGDTSGAVELLRRLALVVGNPYDNLDAAAALLEKTGRNGEAVEFLQQLVKSAPWEPSYELRLAKAESAASVNVDGARDALAKIASSADSPYSLRVEAALGLGTARGASGLGSAELNLLAGDKSTISAAAADQPSFFDARVRAAENLTDPSARTQLLGKALGEDPSRNDVRIALFQAAANSRQDRFSLATIDPVLNVRFPRNLAGRNVPRGNRSAEVNANIPAGIPAEQWPQIAESVGDASARLDRWNDALRYLSAALELEKAAPRRKELSDKIAAAESQLRLEENNLARAPILHQALEQQRVVRPRLAARATPVAAATSGGDQKP